MNKFPSVPDLVSVSKLLLFMACTNVIPHTYMHRNHYTDTIVLIIASQVPLGLVKEAYAVVKY